MRYLIRNFHFWLVLAGIGFLPYAKDYMNFIGILIIQCVVVINVVMIFILPIMKKEIDKAIEYKLINTALKSDDLTEIFNDFNKEIIEKLNTLVEGKKIEYAYIIFDCLKLYSTKKNNEILSLVKESLKNSKG